MFTPYEKENLIFIDTEFSDLNPKKGEILSIGIVKLSGEELYIELEHAGGVSDWVQENILPELNQPKLTVRQAEQVVREFLGDTMPFAVAFIDNYDVIYLTHIFGHGKLPFKWQTIDFASVLFAMGINPERSAKYKDSVKAFYAKLGIDTAQYKKHNALDDARLLRDAWVKATSQ